MAVFANLYVHFVSVLEAEPHPDLARGLKLRAKNADGEQIVEFCLFADDASLTKELAEAINGVFAKRAAASILEAAE